MAPQHIGVIGAGAAGLAAIKQCRDAGFNVTCYEKTDNLGGLWRYRPEDKDGVGSVMRSTIINSSKEVSAFSDFPPSAHLPNYMHNTKMVEYFDHYAHEFKLLPFIKYHREVINVKRADDYDDTGRWQITTRDTVDHSVETVTFDGVLVCTGHHVYPSWPSFKGQELFEGKILHSHSYKTPTGFENDRVVVLGIGNSAGDIAVELSQTGQQVYLSTRRGTWIWNRVGLNGRPLDTYMLTRISNKIRDITPYNVQCWLAETLVSCLQM